MLEALQAEPHKSKIFWFHDLTRFFGWETFVKYLVKRRGAISFTHKARTSVARRYAGQRIVVFLLAGVAAGEDLEHIYDEMWKLKSGVLFCTESGVKTFATPHVVVFADFPVPLSSGPRADAAEEAPADAPVEAPAEVCDVYDEAAVQALTVESILA